MVFAGQDAWRKHPLVANCWKHPLPGLKTATIIFATFCVAECLWDVANGKCNMEKKHVKRFNFGEEGMAGDTMPSFHGKHHH